MTHLVAGMQVVALAYLAGATPFGYLTCRLVRNIDIRQHGSGNIGATNVGRVLGNRWGLFVLVLDFLKGWAPVAGLSALLIAADDPHRVHWQVAAGVATIVGHMFPCWLGFRGGKGVATALGVVACLAPFSSGVAAAVFALAFLVWRIVSLASILGAIAFAVSQTVLLWASLFSQDHWSLAAFSLLVPAMIVVKHRSNIARLLRGEEAKYTSEGGTARGADSRESDGK